MTSPREPTSTIALGEPGWFSHLVEEALSRPVPPGWKGPRDAERQVRELLWAGGVLVGARGSDASSPVRAPDEAQAVLVELMRIQLRLGAVLVRRHGGKLSPPAQRQRLAALMGAHVGEFATAVILDEAARGEARLAERDERRLLGVVGSRLLRRAYQMGNPAGGLPLHGGWAALEARAFVRLAAAYARSGKRLRRRAERHQRLLSRAKAHLVELLAGLWQEAAPHEPPADKLVRRQIQALALSPNDRRAAVRLLQAPRPLAELLSAMPRSLREAAVEHLVLAALGTGRWSHATHDVLQRAAGQAGLASDAVASAQGRVGALLQAHGAATRAWVSDAARPSVDEVLASTQDWLAVAAQAVAQEIRETGELGWLLARQATGEQLTADERRRVREQLIDLAKAVPALAVFAAPGGMLLLPLLLKLLPFDLRPSAFQSRPPPARPTPAPPLALPAGPDDGSDPPPEAA